MLGLISAAATGAQPLSGMGSLIIEICLMGMLVVVAFAIVRMRSLFAIVMLQGVYSLLCAIWFVVLDAVDVAFTEAAVGAGISTVLMLGAMLLTDRKSALVPVRKSIGPLLVVLIAGAAMFYAVPDMPAFGDANSPVNVGPGIDYMTTTPTDVDVPNVVTAVLASYRGYDTMGETVVIFMAGLGVLLLLGLNGNAGNWTAKVNGQNICSQAAPRARVLETPEDQPRRIPRPPNAMEGADVPEPKPELKPKTKPRPAVKKTASKVASPKTVAAKKIASKKTAKTDKGSPS